MITTAATSLGFSGSPPSENHSLSKGPSASFDIGYKPSICRACLQLLRASALAGMLLTWQLGI